MERILNHSAFRSSPQLSAFLDYVVREELAGRGEKIKAYTVAVDALGRPDTFDPSTDPVIRVVASRLRQALDRFYDDGDELEVQIQMIKGTYRPVFLSHSDVVAANDDAPSQPAESGQTRRALRARLRRYKVATSVLTLLLALAMGYIAWDIGTHFAQYGQMPRIAAWILEP